jgi:hypothetical protein
VTVRYQLDQALFFRRSHGLSPSKWVLPARISDLVSDIVATTTTLEFDILMC